MGAVLETRMSVEVCVLASGSGGNCTVVRTPSGTMLLDAGLGPRNTAKRMNGTGVSIKDVSAICLTHLDSDHFSLDWVPTILNNNIRVHCHADGVEKLRELTEDRLIHIVVAFDGSFEPLEGLKFQATVVAHDEKCCCGFVIDGFGCRVGFATDLGHVPRDLIEAFSSLDILAIESNYDPRMQIESTRPAFLKQRI